MCFFLLKGKIQYNLKIKNGFENSVVLYNTCYSRLSVVEWPVAARGAAWLFLHFAVRSLNLVPVSLLLISLLLFLFSLLTSSFFLCLFFSLLFVLLFFLSLFLSSSSQLFLLLFHAVNPFSCFFHSRFYGACSLFFSWPSLRLPSELLRKFFR